MGQVQALAVSLSEESEIADLDQHTNGTEHHQKSHLHVQSTEYLVQAIRSCLAVGMKRKRNSPNAKSVLTILTKR